MNRILHLDCSPRLEGSESARLSRAIVDRLVRKHPGARVIGRPLRQGTIAHVDGDYARALGTPGAAADLARGSLADSEILIRELESADCLVIGTPMHNYTVPSALKAWIDHVVRANRTFTHIPTGKLGVLADRPVYVAVSSGGSFASEPARQPDFLTPYLTAILNTIGLRTIHFFSVQRAAAGGDTLAHARSRAQAELERHFAAVHA
ncbi:FMN-dependent NADH-azoreductase [Achromobacter sp. AONIH1]|uniref:FMN-dependent NADH-azoreductase n=1 Tax=unclassified Achromobacter TaxID=2626865 RepID=UPI000CD1425E|nr:NAD(P)H-dependent oxidoreductase [Achromobacter sp. AONIH1]AUT48140.1 NAD(P)H dehydrogenase [Achromobacter sp. AONIH1]